MLFIGDVHGKFDRYKKIIKNHPKTIQVGDMGVGFYRMIGSDRKAERNPPFDAMAKGNHRFIRGNHDNPKACRQQKFWIPDGHVEGDMMFIGGADSIDKAYRIEGLSWWRDEQLDYAQWCDCFDKYMDHKPRIMVTHDCPYTIYWHLHDRVFDTLDDRTSQSFDLFWRYHKPELWIFGHHHKSFDKVIDGTRFVCLDELETMEI